MSDPVRQLQQASDTDFMRAVLGYLNNPTPAAEELLHHDDLRQRTRAVIGQLLQMADQRDTARHPEDVRRQWRGVRIAARKEREALKNLPPLGAGPRRRALERIGREFPDELVELRDAAVAAGSPKNVRRVLLERIAARHPVRMIEILRQERARDGQPGTTG